MGPQSAGWSGVRVYRSSLFCSLLSSWCLLPSVPFFLLPSSSILAHLGSILDHLGSILGHLGSILGHPGSPKPPQPSPDYPQTIPRGSQRPPEQKSQQKANSSTNCRADLGWEYRIESCIFFLFVLLVQSFSYPTRRRKVHKKSPKIDHNNREKRAFFAKRTPSEKPIFEQKKGVHHHPTLRRELSILSLSQSSSLVANARQRNDLPARPAKP